MAVYGVNKLDVYPIIQKYSCTGIQPDDNSTYID